MISLKVSMKRFSTKSIVMMSRITKRLVNYFWPLSMMSNTTISLSPSADGVWTPSLRWYNKNFAYSKHFSRQNFRAWKRFVASLPLRRNKLEKISHDYLERAETRRIFASDLRFIR